MKSIAELAGKRSRRAMPFKIPHSWPLPDTLMGVEVEVERVPGLTLPTDLVMWTAHSDGSLQNGREFVLRSPMNGTELRTAINELLSDCGFQRSITGSTHIHMDMLEEGDSQEILRVLVMMVYIMEPLLYASGDPGREWCGFANKLMSGPDELLSVVMDEQVEGDSFRENYSRTSSSFGRYYGLNMAALVDYGSLEFRYFPTATKEEELINWIELVQSFKLAAHAVGSVTNFDLIVENHQRFQEFLSTYFSKWSQLFSALGPYTELRSNYRKACITSKLKTTHMNGERFVPTNVFASDKYRKLIKNLPTQGLSWNIIIHNTSSAVPRATYGSILIYNNRVYVCPLEGSPLYEYIGASRGYWTDMEQVPASVLRADAALTDELSLVALQHPDALSSRSLDIIAQLTSANDNIVERARASVAAMAATSGDAYYSVTGTSTEDDPDPEESEMEDE
jgi:Putative amidoligase enzyme.